MYCASLTKIIRDVRLGYGLRHRKWSNTYHQLQENGRRNSCLKFKKMKLKNQNIRKITEVDEPERSVQSEQQRQNCE